jgi:hypothetical protein
VLDPRAEIVLGTPVEWILHQIPGGTNSPAVKINGFGRDTLMNGVESQGGVMFLGELTNIYGGIQNGIFAAEDVTQLSFPWRGIQQFQDMQAWVNMMIGQLPNDRPQQSTGTNGGTTDRTNDYSGYPYTQAKLDADSNNVTDNIDLVGLRFFPLVLGGDDLRLSELQTANSDQTYNLSVTGGFADGDHMILAQYARKWQDTKRAQFVAKVTGGDDPLARNVLGDSFKTATLQRRRPDAHSVTPDQFAYLPWQFA